MKADSSEGRGGLGAPTNTRWLVVAFAVSLAVLQYVDRVCISLAGPLISKDLALSESQMGKVFARADLAPDPNLPDDTKLWAVLQSASGGTWRGCIYDAERIATRLSPPSLH